MLEIPEKYQRLWNDWDIQVFVLFSLFLQVLLIFSAPYRKRICSKRVIFLVWLAYLLADWVAAFALGQLAYSKDNPDCSASGKTGKAPNNDLHAFWAPILLLHLGGPDTITAFALEDNELWLRHLLALVFQFSAATYVFALTLHHNTLLVPTVFMFLTGLIKYIERTCALYLASNEGFRNSMLTPPDAGPNYAKLMDEYTSKLEAGLIAEIEMIKEPENPDRVEGTSTESGSKHVDPVRTAHRFFETFKRMIVDLIFSFHERNESRKLFLTELSDYTKAFEVIEIELNFLYDVLFTKATVIHTRWGYFFRGICTCSILLALLLFLFHKKIGFNEADVTITYTLLIVAMTLDIVAFGMLIFSDWSVIFIKNSRLFPILSRITSRLRKIFKNFGINTPRWSAKMSQFNLISYCLHDHQTFEEKIFKRLHVKEMLDAWRYTSRLDLDMEHDLKKFLYEELKKKSIIATGSEETTRLCSCRGDWALQQRGYLSKLGRSVKVEFDESLLLWHIATDLCYYYVENGNKEAGHQELTISEKHRQCSKLISDYMLYLLVMQPSMMSSMAGIGQIRHLDTCAEAINFFIQREKQNPTIKIISTNKLVCSILKRKDPINPETQTQACNYLLSVNTKVEPRAVKGDRSKSVLFDACILAKQLKELPKMKRWVIISEVWAEMLSYAASHCGGNAHAQQLSNGGELLTFIWFLMAHLGLGEQYRIESGHARAKLIVGQ